MYIYTHNMSCYIRIILWFCFWYPPCPSIRILIWYKNLRTRRLLTIAVKERGCRWLRSSLMTWWLWLCTFLRERLMHIIDAKIEKVISLWPCHRTLLHFSNYQRAKSPACSWGLSIQIAWFWCASVLLFQRNSWFLEVLRKQSMLRLSPRFPYSTQILSKSQFRRLRPGHPPWNMQSSTMYMLKQKNWRTL